MRTRIHSDPFPLISVCVPTYDGNSDSLDSLISSLFKHTSVSIEVIVVDCEKENLGYTKPQNLAMKNATTDILIASNDDVIVHEGWLQPMLNMLNVSGAWCVTPDMTEFDGPQVFAPYFMMWHRWTWEGIGGLDEQFVNWCSDIDIAYRLVELGKPPIRVRLPEAIEHVPGGTSRSNPEMVEQWNARCLEDLILFKRKWGIEAEEAKHELAERVGARSWT